MFPSVRVLCAHIFARKLPYFTDLFLLDASATPLVSLLNYCYLLMLLLAALCTLVNIACICMRIRSMQRATYSRSWRHGVVILIDASLNPILGVIFGTDFFFRVQRIVLLLRNRNSTGVFSLKCFFLMFTIKRKGDFIILIDDVRNRDPPSTFRIIWFNLFQFKFFYVKQICLHWKLFFFF